MAGAATHEDHCVVVIGAGPAGMYLSKKLADAGVDVIIVNRDIKPGGLAEYGIFPTKYKMKGGLRKLFGRILAHENVHYHGGVRVGEDRDLSLEEILDAEPSALVVAAGAQGTKYLGITGERRPGVYHAKDLVYHYNHLPPFSEREYPIADDVLIIGIGNVSIDIAHWLTRMKKVPRVTIMARRGPNERKYSMKEIWYVAENVDRDDLAAEFERVRDRLEAVGQDPDAIREEMVREFEKAPEPKVSETTLRFRFLQSCREFMGEGEEGPVERVRIEHNRLGEPKEEGGRVQCIGTGETYVDEYGTVVFAVGDRVDEGLGLPYEWGQYITHDGESEDGLHEYQVYDPEAEEIIEGVFVAGWSRKASDGLVGVAKKDGEVCADHVLDYLEGQPPVDRAAVGESLRSILDRRGVTYIRVPELEVLREEEKRIAEERDLPEFKFDSDDAMLEVIRNARGATADAAVSGE